MNRVTLLLISLLSLSALAEIPDYLHFPTFKIDLDLPPEERFIEMATAMKSEIQREMNFYLKLAPRFLRNFFRDNEEVIAQAHPEVYREILSMAPIIEVEPALGLMLNYAFELGDALCTSVLARMPDGKVIHGRNMDFGFPDAVRNASYIGQFYKNGEMIFESIMFGGYQGVHTAIRHGGYSMSLNSRGGVPGTQTEKYFAIMGDIYEGKPEIGLLTRDIITACPDFDCMRDTLAYTETILPIYLIMAGMEDNQGIVLSKAPDGVDNIRYLDDENWFLLQTNDDVFDGKCKQRCQDGHEHIQAIGEENINLDNLLEDVILQAHTMNENTIITMMAKPSEEYFKGYGFDSDIPYVSQAAPNLF